MPPLSPCPLSPPPRLRPCRPGADLDPHLGRDAGNDGNDCSRTTPCRTLAAAHAKTVNGGEIDVLDSGDFGSVTVTKSLTILAPGVLGGIQTASGNAITVSANATDKVVLRGLTFDGLGTGASAVVFTSGGSLYIENCTVNNFSGFSIDFTPTSGTGKLFLLDTVVRNNGVATAGGGVHLFSSTSPGATGTIDGLRSENNVVGLKVENLGATTVRNSLIANNTFSGVTVSNALGLGSGTLRVLIENSVTTHNGTNGLRVLGTAQVAIGNLVATDNATGVISDPTSTLASFGINRIWGNGVDVSGTLQNVGQQ